MKLLRELIQMTLLIVLVLVVWFSVARCKSQL